MQNVSNQNYYLHHYSAADSEKHHKMKSSRAASIQQQNPNSGAIFGRTIRVWKQPRSKVTFE